MTVFDIPYQDIHLINQIRQELYRLPTLINPTEVNSLSKQLEKAFHGKAFVVQMGDCAERFSDARESITRLKCDQLLYFQSLIESKLKVPVIAIGRIAGQYAKPRSVATETMEGSSVHAYYGDMINGEHIGESRNPDPHRILKAYHSSKQVLSHIAAFKAPIFTSHECFLLDYEQPLTRSEQGIQYNLGTHLPWLGMRNILSTRHIDYLSTIENSIAIKIGPKTPVSLMISAIQKINPKNQIGKIILVIRLGSKNISHNLPKFIQAIQENRLNVIWICDPLHGNTQNDQYRRKFRLVSDAVDETLQACNILYQHGIHLGGLHLEASYKTDLCECVSSTDELTKNRVYDSALDPRLNHNQCISYLEQVLEKISSFFCSINAQFINGCAVDYS